MATSSTSPFPEIDTKKAGAISRSGPILCPCFVPQWPRIWLRNSLVRSDCGLLKNSFGSFCSMIWRDNVFATQFHPEKSQKDGLRILKNFAELAQ